VSDRSHPEGFALWDPGRDEIIEDARASRNLTPEQRWAIFCSIQRMVAATWEGLSREEMRRRLEVGEKLDPRPDPWWKNIRPEALP
jgi:hypothetical protein